MTTKQIIFDLLMHEPWTRERKNRYKVIWKVIHDKYHKDMLGQETFLIVGPEINSINRWITKHQADDKTLRGKDYDDKYVLVQKKMLDLGYNPGHFVDIKKIDALVPREDEFNDETY